ncbi:MAG: deoxyribodipyrimidine photo-lyase, partial [Rhodothermales bacterium]|nr:deoxyribodipyrimidine photo-lyase [Rhodothermales bacterium]
MNTIVWFGNDLRLTDNPALHRAAKDGTVIPVFIWAPDEEGAWPPGGAHRWWLHHSLSALAADLESAGSGLVVRRGPSEDTLLSLAEETGASRVAWNGRYEPALRKRDAAIEKKLASLGIETVRYQAVTMHDPDQVRTGQDNPYRVFTPFWKKFLSVVTVSESLPRPELAGTSPRAWPEGISIDELSLLPQPDWAGGLRDTWRPGEAGALEVLQSFVDEQISGYDRRRNLPGQDGTSMLSPHLRWGEISPRQVWHYVRGNARKSDGRESYLREIGWREFSYHLLHHFPSTPLEPLNERFSKFPWNDDAEALKLWQNGLTGYPVVDAGMR